MIKKLRKLLLMSFDNNLTQKEQEELKKGCEDFPELVKEKEELSSLMNVLQKRTYSFQQGFSSKIMREIESLSSLTIQNPREYFEVSANFIVSLGSSCWNSSHHSISYYSLLNPGLNFG